MELEEVIVEEQQQQPDPPTKKRLLYDAVSKKYDIGSYEQFEKNINDPAKRKSLYDFAGKEFELGSYQDFEKNLQDSKKKASVDFSGSSLEAGNALSNGVGGEEISTVEMYTTSGGEMVETNPFALSKKFNELSSRTKEVSIPSSGKGGQLLTTTPDEDAKKQAKKLEEDFPDIDLYGIYEETKDIPDEVLQRVGSELIQDRGQNNPLYQRKLANIKWRSGFEKTLLNDVDRGAIEPENYNRIKESIERLPEFTGTGDYTNQRTAIQSLAKDIQIYGGENKDKILNNFAVEVSKVYGNAYNYNADKALKDTPESKYLDNDEQLGLQYIKDLSPELAEQYNRVMIDPKSLNDKPDALMGYNHLKQTLAETSLGLQQNSVTEELNNLKNIAEKNDGLTPEQLDNAIKLEKKNEELAQKREELDKKYPDRIEDKVDDAMQEVLGQKISGGNYAGGKAFLALKHTAQGLWEALSSPVMSDESNNLRELAIMGETLDENKIYHKTDANKGIQYDTLVIKPELQKQIDEIANDKSLTREQKEMKLYPLLKEHRNDFGRVPIQGGKWNLRPSAILYGVTDLGTSLLPFMAVEAATGGIGGAGMAAKFLRTFTAAAATTFHDEYASALMEGKTGSDAYRSAMASTAINSIAMAGAGTPTDIRKMASGMKTSASKIIAQMSDAEIENVLAKGTPKGLKAFGQSFKDRVKATPAMVVQGLKTGAKFEAFMGAANVLNDRDVNYKEMLLGAANFGILGGGLGHIGYKAPNELQKSHGLEFAKNPDEYISVAEQMKKDGLLNQSEFDHRIYLIERYGEAYKTLPKANAKGQPLTEIQKGEYLYNNVIKNEGNKAKSNLPPKQAEKAEITAMAADHANDLILEPKTDKQLEATKSKLEAQLEKKDENGKLELTETERKDAQAELQAINDAIENKPKGEPEKITQPIELSTETKPTDVVGSEVVHRKNIQDKFRKEFEDKNIPSEQVDAALALMDARAKSWASEEKGRKPEQWYQQIADVKNGEFETADVKYQGGKLKSAIIGAAAMLHPLEIKESKINERLQPLIEKIQRQETDGLYPNSNPEKYETKLSKEEEIKFQKWLDDNYNKGRIQKGDYDFYKKNGYGLNYDFRGAFKAGENSEINKSDNKWHWSDIGKKPNHPTFSNESKYNNVDGFIGGKWEGETFIEPKNVKFQESEGVKHGALETLKDGRVVIHALDAPDFSTMVHEIAHVFEADLTASEKQTVKEFGGSEPFARGFEKYLRDGNAPNAELKTLFDKFKQWLTDIYKTLKGSPIEKRITPEIKQIFDRLLTEKEQSLSTKSKNKPVNEEPKVEVQQPSKVEGITEEKPIEVIPQAGEEGKGDIKGITHAANEVRRIDRGLPEYERNPESFEQWNNEAENLIKNGYDVEGLIDRMEKDSRYNPTPVENAIRKIYYATIDAEVAKNPTDKLLTIQKRIATVGDIANSNLGKSLVSLKGEGSPLSSISDFYVAKMDAMGVEKLTEEQKTEVKKQYDHVQETNEAAAAKIKILEEENAKLKAEAEVKRTQGSTKRQKKDYTKVREDLKQSIKDKWKNAGKDVLSSDVPYRAQLFAIAPDVAKLMKSYIEEGVIEFGEIIKRLHDAIKEVEPRVTERDVTDILSGKYDGKKETKGDLLQKLRQIKNKKSEEAIKILSKIKSEDFEKPEKLVSWVDNPELKKKFPKEYNAALDALKKKEDARHEFDIALLRDQMSRWTLKEKVGMWLSKGAGTVKAITTGIDDSAVAIQTYMSLLRRPRTGAVAVYEHFRQGASQKKFNRWLTALHSSADYPEMKAMGLDVTEPSSLKEREKEEIFSNRFNGTIKIKGKEYKLIDAPLKPFERAFTTLGNVTRVVGYRTISAKYRRQGETPENNPELFKSLATRLNNQTGRGAVNEYVDRANKIVTLGIWSPKLMAMKFNTLGVSDLASLFIPGTKGYYRQLHPKERMAAIRDVAQFATTVMALSYGFALANGGEVDDDPLSSTFMDVKLPSGKSYNFTGGFSGYIRAIAQFVAGKKHKDGKSIKTGRLETAGRFFKGKTPPVTSATLNIASGKNFMGQPTTPLNEAINLAPISLRGIAQQIQNDGATSLFTQGIPTFFGFNVKNEKDYPQKLNEKLKEKYTKQDGKELTETDLKDFEDAKQTLIDDNLKKLKEKGIGDTKYKDLTPEEIKEEETYIKSRADDEVKAQMFMEKTPSIKEQEKETKKVTTRFTNYDFTLPKKQ